MRSSFLPEKILQSIEHRSLAEEGSLYSRSCNLFITFEGSLGISAGSFHSNEPVVFLFSENEIILTPEQTSNYVLVRFDPMIIAKALGHYPKEESACIRFSSRDGIQLREMVYSLLATKERTSQNELKFTSCVYGILSILNRSLESSWAIAPSAIPLSSHREKLYRSLMIWIASHCASDIPQGECAEIFGLTPQYLGKFLQETTGMNYRECIRAAAREQQETLQVFYESDLPAPSPAPGLSITSVDDTDNKDLSGHMREYHLRAKIDPHMSFPKFWRTLINLGYAVNLRSQNLDSALQRTCSELGFRYARICRITDLISESRSQGRSFYDFSAVFSLLDSLEIHGIIPFLELGNKAFLIQETTDFSLTPVSPVASKDYYQHLLDVLPHFLRASINHYGQENFDNWCFEISFMYTDNAEREHFGIVQYAEMFRRIYQLIRSFSPSCRIGGPGFNDWSDISKIHQAIQLLTSFGVTPDFFSAYSYPIEISKEGRSSLSEEVNLGFERIRTFTEIVRTMVPDCEIWITEFNSNLSSRNYLNDSVYQAVYITKLVLEVCSLKINALAYYLLSDTPLRYLDSLDFLFGGWGLLTDSDTPKPSFHAFRLLTMLGHYRIRQSGNALITANSTGSFQILLYRYEHPASRFLVANVSRPDLLQPFRVFHLNEVSRFQIRIENAQRGVYIMREYRIDAMHSSLYSTWREYGFLNPPNPSSIRELEQKSALLPNISVQKLEQDDIFTIERTLQGNEVLLITMELYSSRTDALL